jgi:hypothetical protein
MPALIFRLQQMLIVVKAQILQHTSGSIRRPLLLDRQPHLQWSSPNGPSFFQIYYRCEQ